MDWNKVREYKRQDLIDEIQGLECDLDSAVELMARAARGEQTIEAMGEWVSLNYPKYRGQLPEAMRALPRRRS